MPGSAWNWRRTSWITLTAALVTALMASAENQNTSMAPNSPPTNTSGFEMSTAARDRKSTRLNSSHSQISYAVFCLKKKNTIVHSTQLDFTIVTALTDGLV